MRIVWKLVPECIRVQKIFLLKGYDLRLWECYDLLIAADFEETCIDSYSDDGIFYYLEKHIKEL